MPLRTWIMKHLGATERKPDLEEGRKMVTHLHEGGKSQLTMETTKVEMIVPKF